MMVKMTLKNLHEEFLSVSNDLKNAIVAEDSSAILLLDKQVSDAFQRMLDYEPANLQEAISLSQILLHNIPGADPASKLGQAIEQKLLSIVKKAGGYSEN